MLLQKQEEAARKRAELEAERLRQYEEEKLNVQHANGEILEKYEAERDRFHTWIQGLHAEKDAARAEGKLLKWVGMGIRLRGSKRSEPRAPALYSEPQQPRPFAYRQTREEAKLEAGMRGEREVASFLADSLGEEWTLVRGYRNRRGEIDQLLLGPVGIIAIEVKYWNATVHIRGEEWFFEKYDNYDNRVTEPKPMTDAKGRSPSQELNEPADELQEFLARRGQPTPITRVVLLTHENSKLGSWEDFTGDVADYTGYVLELIDELEAVLDSTRRAKVEELVVRDHNFHEKQRKQRPRR